MTAGPDPAARRAASGGGAPDPVEPTDRHHGGPGEPEVGEPGPDRRDHVPPPDRSPAREPLEDSDPGWVPM